MKSWRFLGVLLTITFAFGQTVVADPIRSVPLFADAELLSVTAQRCHEAVKYGLALYNTPPDTVDKDGFQFGANSTVSIAAWCLPHFQNPGDIWLVIAISSTDSATAENARDDFSKQVKSWLANPLNK